MMLSPPRTLPSTRPSSVSTSSGTIARCLAGPGLQSHTCCILHLPCSLVVGSVCDVHASALQRRVDCNQAPRKSLKLGMPGVLQTVQYIQPSHHAALAQAELLVIDEAAAIPLPLVKAMLGPYLVFLCSTVNGWARHASRLYLNF